MTDTLDQWPSDEAPLDVWLRPLSALCDSPRSHAYALTEFEGRGKETVERRLKRDGYNARRGRERAREAKAKQEPPKERDKDPGWQTNHERRARLQKMVDQGMTVNQMAEAEGMAANSVRSMLRRMKVKAAQDRMGPEPDNTDELERLFHEGVSYRQMGKRLGIHPRNLVRKLQKMGLRRT